MFAPTPDTYIDLATALLIHYSFDLSGYQASDLVLQWQSQFPANWLHLAVVEALYQGRYKAFSVQQILAMWQRREQATFHFNMEFERLICSKFPTSLIAMSTSPLALVPTSPDTSNSHYSNNPNNFQAASVTKQTAASNNTKKSIESYIKNKYKEEQLEEVASSGIIRKSACNTQVIDSHSESHVTAQMVKFVPPVIHSPPIEQFSPEKCDRTDELFASKMKAIVGVESQELSV
ncbi:hypothetical protein CK510_10760 [Brunnivagina elsteri CCALA 953]|uniref:Uncharacterized protein n=2 Tax=Brunnivagina TaxID=3344733 RepID=A0A2A2TJY0_9CYAN|nr:hypothetical protein CK510_10760 [Calothrix elsteri CCALA 953]